MVIALVTITKTSFFRIFFAKWQFPLTQNIVFTNQAAKSDLPNVKIEGEIFDGGEERFKKSGDDADELKKDEKSEPSIQSSSLGSESVPDSPASQISQR